MSFKIALLSDIHLEHSNFQPEVGDADVVVVAGDLMAGPKPEHGVLWLRQKIVDRPVIYVPGNHEFEGTRITEALLRMKEAAEGSLIEVLHNESFEWGGVRFLGTPLYSGFRYYGEGPMRDELMKRCKAIGDFSSTMVAAKKPWTPHVMSDWHDEACAWLSGELEECEIDEIPSVVVTHWAPALGSTDPRFEDDISGYWINRCEGLVERSHMWLHGHVHSSSHYRVGGFSNRGEVWCNPRGVTKFFNLSPNMDFNPHLKIEVPKWTPKQSNSLEPAIKGHKRK